MKSTYYYCSKCKRLVSLQVDGGGDLICCDTPMSELVPNSSGAAIEKHLPIITASKDGYLVSIGAVTHPMTSEHYIQVIALVVDGVVHTKTLTPTDTPSYQFKVASGKNVEAYAFCNLHALWSAKLA
jgi:superoxide reductase